MAPLAASGLIEVVPGLMIWTLISFGITFFVLKRYVFGALGAGVGIGNIFGSMIQAVARQPELKGELTGIQWLGFALTEAVVFYGLLGSILAFVLV